MTINLVSFCAAQLAVSQQTIRRIASSARHKYKRFKIPKRRSGEFRDVAQPSRDVKALQRCIVNQLSPLLPIHERASAYKIGASIRDNAKIHLNSHFILKLDFCNFFDSITHRDLIKLISEKLSGAASESEAIFIADATTWRRSAESELALCIGAPSSPFFSNAIMNEFDHLVALDSQNLGVEYSRYSDDITFSGPSRQVLLEIEKISASRLRDLSFPRLEFNPRKRVLVSSGSHRTVTGLTLATQGFVSIGRVRRRGIRAALHHLRQGKLSKDEILALRGEIAFAQGVEADFAVQLARTYGELVWKLVRGEI